MYSIKIKPSLDEKFIKLSKKDKKQMEIISRKIDEIIQNPQHYKNLRAPLQHLKRVHIGKSFVLVFSVDESTKTITLEDYDHHDVIYKS
ncbi:MAG: hypothetical protein Q8Q31_04635 [Nanoarchaeota archaeon]|nr:hypothetical protein [Nanoarchaeota archaeon]